jgi:hypothetical protein
VLHIRVGEDVVLLGSDLEVFGTGDHGWDAVLSAPERPKFKAAVYKVAHHGSQNGEHPGIWDDLLVAGPTAIMTPFRRGKVRLPTPGDRARILGKSQAAYITSDKSARPNIRGYPMKVLKRRTRTFSHAQDTFGTIRMRKSLGGAGWSTELFGAAHKLD